MSPDRAEPLPSEYWLYLSGGGFRAALGAIGVLLELGRTDPNYWSKVTRVVSVSGGSLTNAVLAGLPEDADPAPALAGLYRRITDRGGLWMWRTVLTLLFTVGLAVAADQVLSRWSVAGGRIAAALVVALSWRRHVRAYQRDRISHIVGGVAGLRLADLVVRHRATHVFSTSSALSGSTVYFGVRRDQARMITDLGVTSGYFDRDVADHDTVLDLVDAGSLFPVLRQPWSRHGTDDAGRAASLGRQVRHVTRHAATSVAASLVSDPEQTAPARPERPRGRWRPPKRPRPVPLDRPGRVSPDLLWDGGINGLFASRLDPRMYHSSNDGISMIIEALDDPTEGGGTDSVVKTAPKAVPSPEVVRRIVTDAGQWMRPTGSLRWVLRVPVVGMVAAAHRAVKLGLNGLVGVDRELATLADNLYVPVTGSAAVFLLADARRGRWVVPTTAAKADPVVRRVVEAKERAERLGLLTGGRYAYDCVLAGAYGLRIHPLSSSGPPTVEDLDEVESGLRRSLDVDVPA